MDDDKAAVDEWAYLGENTLLSGTFVSNRMRYTNFYSKTLSFRGIDYLSDCLYC